jgi:hypothetical protein
MACLFSLPLRISFAFFVVHFIPSCLALGAWPATCAWVRMLLCGRCHVASMRLVIVPPAHLLMLILPG